MKWLYRLFTLAILAVAMGLPFFIDNKDGKPMLSIPEVSDLVPGTSSSNESSTSMISRERTVFKWQDSQGGWHYGDTPPPGALNVSSLTVDSNTNVIQSIPTEKDKAEEAGLAGDSQPKNTLPSSDEDLLSLDRAMNILNETKDVAAMMEARNDTLNQIVGESPKK